LKEAVAVICTWEGSFKVAISLVVVALVLLASVATVARTGAICHPKVRLILPTPLN
jgi:hypothetical protein